MNDTLKQWDVVIGLEVHVQLSSKTKMFAPTNWNYGESPNTQICPITLGCPGVLPTINKEAVKKGILIGLALNCSINKVTKFARKHYFYPDLPKGYQISQFIDPLCENGYLDIYGKTHKKIRIQRAHLEEDAGKTIHTTDEKALIDYNRAGAPLLEIVTHPDISCVEEATLYLNSLKEIIMSVGASDCNMEKGNLRVDLNISLKRVGAKELGVRREVKNINSFRNVEKAINYECMIQQDLLENGGVVHQETLVWDDKNMKTELIRKKEDAHDYRYFPEPDLPPLEIGSELIAELAESMPELPNAKRNRLKEVYHLDSNQIEYLLINNDLLNYFVSLCDSDTDNAHKYFNWVSIEMSTYLKEKKIEVPGFPISQVELKKLIDSEIRGVTDHSKAKMLFYMMIDNKLSFESALQSLESNQSENNLGSFVDDIIKKFPDEKHRLLSGETKLINFFMGQIMKESNGRFSPSDIKEILDKKFNK